MRIGHNLPFVSKKGATITNASIAAGKNSLDLTLRDFRSGRNVASKELNQNYRSALERAIGSINSHINADASYSKILGKDRVNAELLVRRGLADVDEFWQEAYPRYNSLIRSVLSERKSGGLHSIADKPIVANSGQPRWYEIADQKPSHGDFRNLIDNSTYIINMAESFAIIEYLMREELTGYVNAAMLPLYNLKRTSSAKFNSRHDLHSGGKVITTYAMTMYYRAYASCLNELIESLKNYSSKSKGGSLFDHTLISMTSEFNRSARDDGTGADHGFRAHSISLHGGMIKGPLVLGDIKRGETSGRYKGTWGEAAPTRLLNGESEVIKIGHIAETILTLLGIPGLSVNAFSLMTKDGKPLTKKARLV